MSSDVQRLDPDQLHSLVQARLGIDAVWWIEPTVTLAEGEVVCMGRGGWPEAPFDEMWVWPADPVAPVDSGAARPVALHAVRSGKAFRARLCELATDTIDNGLPVWMADTEMRARHGLSKPAELPDMDWALRLDARECVLWFGASKHIEKG